VGRGLSRVCVCVSVCVCVCVCVYGCVLVCGAILKRIGPIISLFLLASPIIHNDQSSRSCAGGQRFEFSSLENSWR
jgi:hypothetical protein